MRLNFALSLLKGWHKNIMYLIMNKISPFIIVVEYELHELEIGVEPIEKSAEGEADSFQLFINEQNSGVIFYLENRWIATDIEDGI